MITFYSAVGAYKIQEEHGLKMPYIQKLGKLYPLSIPEFVVWSALLWEVMTHDELQQIYDAQIKAAGIKGPSLDDMLSLLLRRRLIIKGIGYTGEDALYSMLEDAFVIPYRISYGHQALSLIKYWLKGQIGFREGLQRLYTQSNYCSSERRVIKLIEQTPLSTAELVSCFDNDISDVSTPEKVISGIYPEAESTQGTLMLQQRFSPMRQEVIKAVANLYIRHSIILETAYPWCVLVENGLGVKETNAQGGSHMKHGTYLKLNSVFVNINDFDFYTLMKRTVRYIEAWELTYAPKLIRDAQQLSEADRKAGQQ